MNALITENRSDALRRYEKASRMMELKKDIEARANYRICSADRLLIACREHASLRFLTGIKRSIDSNLHGLNKKREQSLDRYLLIKANRRYS